MPALTRRDYEGLLACVGKLHDCEDLDAFGRLAVTEIPKLIGAGHSTFNYLAPDVPRVVVVASHEPPDHGRREETFARLMGGHPVLQNYLATGDGSAHLISDFQSRREYHALPLYREFYRELRYEDQLACMLLPAGSQMVALSFARDRRSFTERDRWLLNLLRPHAARAYIRCEQIARLRHRLRDEFSRGGVQATSVLLDAGDRPVRFTAHAGHWLARFFPDWTREARRLPDAVTKWLQRRHQHRLRRRSDALLLERDGHRLRLQVTPGPTPLAGMLVLELRARPTVPGSRRADDLTGREVEVLLELERGSTNREIAAALGISALTVRTHLEHIFGKLHTANRTAAVVAFRRQCSPEDLRPLE